MNRARFSCPEQGEYINSISGTMHIKDNITWVSESLRQSRRRSLALGVDHLQLPSPPAPRCQSASCRVAVAALPPSDVVAAFPARAVVLFSSHAADAARSSRTAAADRYSGPICETPPWLQLGFGGGDGKRKGKGRSLSISRTEGSLKVCLVGLWRWMKACCELWKKLLWIVSYKKAKSCLVESAMSPWNWQKMTVVPLNSREFI